MGTGAFHGLAATKALYLTRAQAAERDGRIVQGLYFRPDDREAVLVR